MITKSGKIPMLSLDEGYNKEDDNGEEIGSQMALKSGKQTVIGSQRGGLFTVHEISKFGSLATAIGDWKGFLSLLEKELFVLERVVSCLLHQKEEAKTELVKIATQVDFDQLLFFATNSKLVALELECKCWKVKAHASNNIDLER